MTKLSSYQIDNLVRARRAAGEPVWFVPAQSRWGVYIPARWPSLELALEHAAWLRSTGNYFCIGTPEVERTTR